VGCALPVKLELDVGVAMGQVCLRTVIAGCTHQRLPEGSGDLLHCVSAEKGRCRKWAGRR